MIKSSIVQYLYGFWKIQRDIFDGVGKFFKAITSILDTAKREYSTSSKQTELGTNSNGTPSKESNKWLLRLNTILLGYVKQI